MSAPSPELYYIFRAEILKRGLAVSIPGTWRLVRRYEYMRRIGSAHDPIKFLTIAYADPTGETAVHNVLQGRNR